ncbi:glycosyltransferase family 2 protein, partial [Halorubrum sp. SS5]
MTDISVIIPTLKPRDEVECIDHLESNSFSDYEVCLQSEPTATSARNAGIERAESDKL